jgi:hypothetical protein
VLVSVWAQLQEFLFFSRVTGDGVSLLDGTQLSFAGVAAKLSGTSINLWNVEERLVPHPMIVSVWHMYSVAPD